MKLELKHIMPYAIHGLAFWNEDVKERCLLTKVDIDGGFVWVDSLAEYDKWIDVLTYEKDPQPLIEAYKSQANEHPELMDIFSRFEPIEQVVEPTEVIDWSKPLQVVESSYAKILHCFSNSENCFSGVILSAENKGAYRSSWQKSDFKLCQDQTVKF